MQAPDAVPLCPRQVQGVHCQGFFHFTDICQLPSFRHSNNHSSVHLDNMVAFTIFVQPSAYGIHLHTFAAGMKRTISISRAC